MNISQKSDMKSFLEPTIKAISTALELPAAIWLFDEEKKEFRIVCACGLSDEFIQDAVVSEERAVSVIKEKFENQKSLIVPDIQASPFWRRKEAAEKMNLKSAVASTLRIKTQAVGGLVVYIPKDIRADLEKLAVKIETFAVEIANTLRYVRGLDILNKSAQLINEEMLSTDVFEQILKSAVDILNCEHINLFLPEKESNDLVLKETSTPDIQKKNRFKFGEGLVGWVAQTGESLYVPNVKKDKRFVKGTGPFSNEKERSMLLSPIKSKDKNIIGVICADAIGLNVFDAHDQMLWESFTRQTEIALQNKELYEQIQGQRDSQLQAIGKISASITGSFDLEQVLGNILYWTRKLIGEPNLVEIRLLDKMTNELVVKCFQGTSTDDKYKRIPIGKGITGWVGKHKKSQLINDVSKDDRYIRFLDGTNSELAVPICKNDNLIGVLNIEHPELEAFKKDHLQLAEAIANLAAVAIDNAKFYDNIEKKVDKCTLEVNAAYKISQVAQNAKNLKEFYSKIYEIISRLIPYAKKNFRIGIYNDAKQKFEVPFFKDEKDTLSDDDLLEKGVTGYVFRTGKSLICTPEKREELIKRGEIKQIGYPSKSWLGVPLKKEDKCIGVIVVQSYDEKDVYKEYENILEFVSAQIAMAIERVEYREELEKKVQRRTARLWAAYDISKAAYQFRNLDKLYPEIKKIISGLMNADHFYIILYDAIQEKLELAYCTNEKDRYLPMDRILKKGLIGYVIRTGQALLASPEKFEELVTQGEVEKIGEQSIDWLGVPLKTDGKIIGVLAVKTYDYDIRYTETDKEILMFVSEQIAMAIERVRKQEELESSKRDLEERTQEILNLNKKQEKLNQQQKVLIDLAQKLTSSIQLTEDGIFNIIREKSLGLLMEMNNMYIALYDEQTDLILFPLSLKNNEPFPFIEGEERRKTGKKGRTEYIIERKKSLICKTKEEATAWYNQPGHGEFGGDPLASFIGVPMKAGDKVLGVVATYHPTKDNVYSEDDRDILQTMANIAAIALQNARLYRELEAEKSKELERKNKELEERVRQLKDAHQTIAEKERALERSIIASDFIHNLNNLAGTIPVWANFLKEKTEDLIFAIQRDVNKLLREGEKLKKPVQEEKIDMNLLLHTVLDNVRTQYMEKIQHGQLEIKEELSEKLYNIKGVISNLSDAVHNVVLNGIESVPEKGSGTITVKSENCTDNNQDWIKIEITDTGEGIPEKDIKNIFEHDFSSKGKDRGYGLWRTKYIIEKYSGKIEVKSEVGEGSSFVIFLPKIKEND